jgi:hypothetical protein
MAHAFKIIPAKPAFGTIHTHAYASDYLENKKAKLAFCSGPSYCNRLLKGKNYEQRLLFQKGFYLNNLEKCTILPFNKANLEVGLYAKENLHNITVLENESTNVTPTTINTSATPFYKTYTIDPSGQLFGNTPCGILNYTRYMEINPPTITTLSNM